MRSWCSTCSRYVNEDNFEGKVCCPLCGKILFDDSLSDVCTFVKGSNGESMLSGNFTKTIESDISLSRLRTVKEAEDGIEDMVYALQIDGGDSIVRPALRLYTIALERNFTRGRRKEQVEAACLYIACRESKKPYLLIDFSEHLRINVYVLGGVFLQLCKLLSLEEHPTIQKPVDPSLFIHRFADRLFEGKNKDPNISKIALQIIASTKRDWMQTGRKPSGLCGLALYVSALSQGHHFTKTEIIKIVHVCEATLTKRLIEFENTESGGMTIDEFMKKAEELEREELPERPADARNCGLNKVLCEHVKQPVYAHGLCEECYKEFLQLSGGLDGGAEPPSFQRAEMERAMAKGAEDETPAGDEDVFENPEKGETLDSASEQEHARGADFDSTDHPEVIFQNESAQAPGDESVDATDEDCVGPETFSDIPDSEVGIYILNDEEKQLKTIIWEAMNKEYLEEQAAKKAAAMDAAAREENMGTPKKKKRQPRKTYDPAQTAAEATMQAFERKRLNRKVRLDLLEKLFDEDDAPANKKSRTDGFEQRDHVHDRVHSEEAEEEIVEASSPCSYGGNDIHKPAFDSDVDNFDFSEAVEEEPAFESDLDNFDF